MEGHGYEALAPRDKGQKTPEKRAHGGGEPGAPQAHLYHFTHEKVCQRRMEWDDRVESWIVRMGAFTRA